MSDKQLIMMEGGDEEGEEFMPLGDEWEGYEKVSEPKIEYPNGVFATPTQLQKFENAKNWIDGVWGELALDEDKQNEIKTKFRDKKWVTQSFKKLMRNTHEGLEDIVKSNNWNPNIIN